MSDAERLVTNPEQLDRYERLDVLARIAGFMPAGQNEQNEAISLYSFIGQRGATARHLAEVAIQQGRAGIEDTLRGPRSIVRKYGKYAADAQMSAAQLALLGAELEDVNPGLTIDQVTEPDQPGLLPYLRFYDLSLVRQTKDKDAPGYDPQKVDYLSTNPGIVYYLELKMPQWPVKEVRGQLPKAISNEASRSNFWTERLAEVDTYYPKLRPVVRDVLDKLSAQPAS